MTEQEKQIEEIDNLTTIIWEANHKKSVLNYHWLATEVYNAGYRKESEVAREMSAEMGHEIAEALKSNYKALSEFEEADELYYRVKGKIDALRGIQDFLAELEKKYIGETK